MVQMGTPMMLPVTRAFARFWVVWMFPILLVSGQLPAAGAAEPASMPSPYVPTHGTPLKTSMRLVHDRPGHKQYRVEFNGIKGDRVPAYLYVPKSAEKKHPAVLLQYGSGGHKDSGYIVQIGRFFADHGFIVLTIDSPGKGERAPRVKHWYDSLDLDRGRALFVQYLGDYSRAVDYLVSLPDVDPGRIGYVGISWGAITGITYVAHDPRIRAMAALVAGGDVVHHLPIRVSDDFKKELAQLDPVNHIALIAPRPLLLINVKHDELIPHACAEALHRAAGKGSRVVWLDTDHNFRNLDRIKVAQSVADFLRQSMPLSQRTGPAQGTR